MPLNLLLAWWNLIYIVPFALAVVYLGLFVFTGITFGDADADFDADADMDADTSLHVEAHVVDVDADADVDVDADADLDADADADMDADADADSDASAPHTAVVHPHAAHGIMPHLPAGEHSFDHAAAPHSFVMGLLMLLGLGKIPVSLALMILLLCWGFIGFALNALLVGWFGPTPFIALGTLPLTLLTSFTLTGLLATGVSKIIPPDEENKERRQDLVGRPGEAMYDINESFGMAKVRGKAGDFLQVHCRTAPGKPIIAKGARIVLFDYDRSQNVFTVAPFDASST